MQREIVEDARRGSRAAFDALASQAIDRLYGAAVLMLHDPSLAEDAVQETLIQAWRDIERLRDPDRFDGWLHRVLVHRCLDLARRRRRPAVELPATLADPVSVETLVGQRDAIRRGLERLRPRERAALVLRYYLDMTVPQVADALRCPLGTAKSRLHAAEASMRAALELDSRLALERGPA